MNLTSEFNPFREWADNKGIYAKSDRGTQIEKLEEEWHELLEAQVKNDKAGINDAIGDMINVLTHIAHLNGTTIEQCCNDVYKIVSQRNGKMIDGKFVKDGK